MTKKNNEVRFIQIGMKRNGKIVCNEEFELNKYFNETKLIEELVAEVKTIKLKWFDKVFKTKRYKHNVKVSHQLNGSLTTLNGVQQAMNLVIDEDLENKTLSKRKAVTKTKKKSVKGKK